MAIDVKYCIAIIFDRLVKQMICGYSTSSSDDANRLLLNTRMEITNYINKTDVRYLVIFSIVFYLFLLLFVDNEFYHRHYFMCDCCHSSTTTMSDRSAVIR